MAEVANKDELKLIVLEGPLAGKTFTPDGSGLRLGRSSSCEISVPDPSLSRNQCLFELREGAIWVTDLASANGTLVNDEELGEESCRLKPGDRIVAGDTVILIGNQSDAESTSSANEVTPLPMTEVDLGFSSSHEDVEHNTAASAAPISRRFLLWAVTGAIILIALLYVLFEPMADRASGSKGAHKSMVKNLSAEEAEEIVAVAYERVSANGTHIFRYALDVDRDGVLSVTLDDVPVENRHLPVKRVKLSERARKSLAAVFASPDFFRLDRRYEGGGSLPGEYVRISFKVIRRGSVFETTVENAPEPPALATVRDRLEAFSRNELGIWATQYSTEKLIAMSLEGKKAGDAKWEERDVRESNLAAAIKAYADAEGLLETVNPKPDFHEKLREAYKRAVKERDARYENRRFAADRAIKLGDWSAAQSELCGLLELVPEASDERHREVTAKLLDVERRQKQK